MSLSFTFDSDEQLVADLKEVSELSKIHRKDDNRDRCRLCQQRWPCDTSFAATTAARAAQRIESLL